MFPRKRWITLTATRNQSYAVPNTGAVASTLFHPTDVDNWAPGVSGEMEGYALHEMHQFYQRFRVVACLMRFQVRMEHPKFGLVYKSLDNPPVVEKVDFNNKMVIVGGALTQGVISPTHIEDYGEQRGGVIKYVKADQPTTLTFVYDARSFWGKPVPAEELDFAYGSSPSYQAEMNLGFTMADPDVNSEDNRIVIRIDFKWIVECTQAVAVAPDYN